MGQFLHNKKCRLKTLNVQKINNLILHHVILESGEVNIGDKVKMEIDIARRKKIAANHSSTHLLNQALRQVLGDHVEQKGSMVHSGEFRFDFSHYAKVSNDELKQVEQFVNARIQEHIDLEEDRNTPYNKAIEKGAMALFGEKYGEEVRVVFMGKESNGFFSTELCGGTHVKNTKEVGKFKVISQSSIASGVRRVEALRDKQLEEYEKCQKQDKSTKEKTSKDLLEKIKKE